MYKYLGIAFVGLVLWLLFGIFAASDVLYGTVLKYGSTFFMIASMFFIFIAGIERGLFRMPVYSEIPENKIFWVEKNMILMGAPYDAIIFQDDKRNIILVNDPFTCGVFELEAGKSYSLKNGKPQEV